MEILIDPKKMGKVKLLASETGGSAAPAVIAAWALAEAKNDKAIPSEAELCERYGVSRGTVRRAIQTLVQEGYLTNAPLCNRQLTERRILGVSLSRKSAFCVWAGHRVRFSPSFRRWCFPYPFPQ